MKKNSHNIITLLKQWGNEQQQLSVRNHEMKQRMLSAARGNRAAPAHKPRRYFRWFGYAAATLVVGVLAVQLFIPMFPAEPYVSYNRGGGGGLSQVSDNITESSAVGLGCGYSDDPYCTNTAQTMNLSSSPKISAVQKLLEKISASDTREFLKTDYAANIKTRHTEQLGTQIMTMVRGHDGRIDTASLQKKSGYLVFVIPKSSLEPFRTELTGIVNPRFLDEQLYIVNKLPEKKTIEENTEVTTEMLDGLEKKREALIATHEKTVASLNQKIRNFTNSIAGLNAEVTTSTKRQAEIKNQVAYFSNQRAVVQKQLTNENATYKTELDRLDTDIAVEKQQLTVLAKQDTALLDDVETVEGSIQLEWVNVWGIINLYIAWYWFLALVCLVLLVIYPLFWRRAILTP